MAPSAGFTLLEVLVVLVIIGIITAMAVVSTAVLGKDRQLDDWKDDSPPLEVLSVRRRKNQPRGSEGEAEHRHNCDCRSESAAHDQPVVERREHDRQIERHPESDEFRMQGEISGVDDRHFDEENAGYQRQKQCDGAGTRKI